MSGFANPGDKIIYTGKIDEDLAGCTRNLMLKNLIPGNVYTVRIAVIDTPDPYYCLCEGDEDGFNNWIYPCSSFIMSMEYYGLI